MHSLPYFRYPRVLAVGCVIKVCKDENSLPAQNGVSSTTSPGTFILGTPRPDFNVMSRLNFGDYVHVFEVRKTTNSMKPRTIGAIALYPSNNGHNSWYFMSLTTGKRIHRYQWTVLPMGQVALNRVHEIAEQEGQPLITGDNFTYERELGEAYEFQDQDVEENNHHEDVTDNEDAVINNEDEDDHTSQQANEDQSEEHSDNESHDNESQSDHNDDTEMNNQDINGDQNENDDPDEDEQSNHEDTTNYVEEEENDEQMEQTSEDGENNSHHDDENEDETRNDNVRSNRSKNTNWRYEYERQYQMLQHDLDTLSSERKRTNKHYKGRKKVKLAVRDRFRSMVGIMLSQLTKDSEHAQMSFKQGIKDLVSGP